MPNGSPNGPPGGSGTEARAGRTYVAYRWLRDGWADRPVDEVTPLGTVRARSRAAARERASAAWPDERAALRVRRASACRLAVLLAALAADGARLNAG